MLYNEISPDQKLPSAAVLRRYSIVDRTLARWLDNPKLGFPRPTIINGRRYWRVGDLAQWDRDRAAAERVAA